MCSPRIYVQKDENASVHGCGMQRFPEKCILKNACDNNAGKLFDLPYSPLFAIQLLYSVSLLYISLSVLENTNYNSLLLKR